MKQHHPMQRGIPQSRSNAQPRGRAGVAAVPATPFQSVPLQVMRLLAAMLMIVVSIPVFAAPLMAQEGQEDQVAQPGGELPGNPAIELVQIAGGLADPVNVSSPPDDDRLFVVERIGRVQIIDGDGQMMDEPFLDISSIVKTDFLEQGLLDITFHPDYAENGRFFVYYVDWNSNGDVYLVEYSVADDDPNQADPASAQVLLTHDEPYVNHNGGTIHFGPDGYLYVALGDGGLAGDPYNNAQNTSTLLGSILRLDVDSVGPGVYAIPEDNPFAQGVIAGRPNEAARYHPGAAPEIWAYGLRNPWEFSFDSATGDLYIADVGQNAWEEVHYQPADSEGGINYGWDFLEGSHCYPAAEEDCGRVGELPVAEYNHDDGSCSITGGGVYRGEAASLDGIYFNSDFCSGKVWGLAQVDGTWQYAELLDTELKVTGAGTDSAGNVYFTSCNCEFSRDYDPLADPQGALWQVVAADMVPEGAETAGSTGDADDGASDGAESDGAQETATPSVSVDDQAVDAGTVTVAEVVSDGPGWIVIHANQDGAPGPVIGHAAVEDGTNENVSVEIDSGAITETLYAMLHTDAGDVGAYEFPGADTPVQVEGNVVTPSFMVTNLESIQGEAGDTAADEGETNEVEVGLLEWEIDMPTELSAGPTTFVVTNIGDFDHNFEIEGQGIEQVFDANLAPGETMEMTVDLVPGEYYVYCPIGTHASQGMELTLVVN